MYIESICGDCHRFIANELKFIALNPILLDYVNITLNIFGKARVAGQDPPRFYCQFGEKGCIGNKALNCINAHSASFTEAIEVMQCMFETGYTSEESIRMCYSKFHGDSEEAVRCFTGEESNTLLLQAAHNTPELHWVPAFKDGDRIRVDTRNFINFICDHISGVKPDVCLKHIHTVGMEADLFCVCLIEQIICKRLQ